MLPKYDTILFDADGTLLDFAKSEEMALQKTFAAHQFPLNEAIKARYQAAADACGLDMSIMTQTYSALTDAQRALVEQANAVLAADETAVHASGMVIQLSIHIVRFGVLSGYLLV